MKIVTKKRAAAAAALVALAGGGIAAYAYWTGGGSGTGSAPTGTPSALTVVQTTPSTNLFPGGPSVSLSGTFNNPNPGPITVTTLTASITSGFSSQTDGTKPACTASDFSLTGTATIGGSGVVPAGNSQGSWSGLSISMTNSALNQDNCKGVSVPITYTAS